MSKYTPPKLDGHKVLYKGKRYWIYEIDEEHPCTEHPYETFERYYEVVVYDKLEALPVAFCHRDLTGDLNLGTFQSNLTVSGTDYRSLISNIEAAIRYFDRLMR